MERVDAIQFPEKGMEPEGKYAKSMRHYCEDQALLHQDRLKELVTFPPPPKTQYPDE